MGHPQIVVLNSLGAEERGLLEEILSGIGYLTYLVDLPGDERARALGIGEVLMSWSPAKELQSLEYGSISKARLLQLITAGLDHVPFSLLPSSLVIAGNVGAYAEPIAEHVLGMALALSKRLLINHYKLKNGEFDQITQTRVLKGAVCAILGFGGIGQATARLMRCVGLKVYAVNTSGSTQEAVDFVGTVADLERVLGVADVIVVSLPLSRSTRGLIGPRELGWMKPDATLINVARGEIVRQEALYDHLRTHPNFMAAVDTWWVEPASHGQFRVDYPFFALPNFLGSPHNSAIVPGAMLEAVRRAAENVRRFLMGQPISGIVKREDYQES